MLFNLHGDTVIHDRIYLTVNARTSFVRQYGWNLVYAACNRLGFRYDYFV
jgi:hypothetical protein